ncbi:hypothetical protein [Rhodopirellula sp. MGV]|uniref:type IV pilus modification PilV family protein n=1 Tax=Rhodopirellula sp. MGV TaxID=2023130 RepID=UPI000B974A3E|nr:hypothetical protein [Rhodopirellula sp. MGV]OYP31014.1 hypothetical protein CGZ80_21805 [Rhodopirellula sp. MGV]PNY34638.1 hypothetical protein C2E31_21900 [Rhodopirellula baltica]
MKSPTNPNKQRRDGFTVLEALVAMGLAVATLGVFAPMALRSARTWKETTQYQLATDELSAMLDRLIVLDDDQRSEALESLTVRSELSSRLPGATLQGKVIVVDDERRLELKLNWQRIGNPPPVKLVGWITANPSPETPEES